jgi:hypothetical protein
LFSHGVHVARLLVAASKEGRAPLLLLTVRIGAVDQGVTVIVDAVITLLAAFLRFDRAAGIATTVTAG